VKPKSRRLWQKPDARLHANRLRNASELGKWPVRVALVAAFALATAYFAYRLGRKLQSGPLVERNGIDFSINWTAALALRDGTSLYAGASLRALSIRHIGAWTAPLYASTFTSYLGPPSTAMLHLPYTWLPFGVALVIHRFESGLLFVASVFITGLALPKESRVLGWLVGSLALLTFQGIVISLAVGQIDGWVMLGLAIAFYGVRTRRWGLVGIGIGVAATLKVTPILLLAYLVLRRQWRAAFVGAATCIVLVGAGTSVAGFSDLRTFVTDVAPKLGAGSIDSQNQSLPAYAARVLGGDTNFLDLQAGLGGYRYLGLFGAAALILTIAWRRRTHPLTPLEIGVVLLVSLVFAPITWDHSATWAILVLVLLADRRLWPPGVAPVLMVGAGAALMAIPTRYYTEAQIQNHTWLRFATGTTALGLSLWFVATWILLEARAARFDRAVPVAGRP
jgi:hypothetical protein